MPEPSRLVLLEQVQTLPSGTKIRFLACVHSYHPREAQLMLRDKYPSAHSDLPTVVANIENVLETIDHELLQVGSWLNIVGYTGQPQVARERRPKCLKPGVKPEASGAPVVVEATMIWSAGSIKVDAYKSAAQEYQKLATAG